MKDEPASRIQWEEWQRMVREARTLGLLTNLAVLRWYPGGRGKWGRYV